MGDDDFDKIEDINDQSNAWKEGGSISKGSIVRLDANRMMNIKSSSNGDATLIK